MGFHGFWSMFHGFQVIFHGFALVLMALELLKRRSLHVNPPRNPSRIRAERLSRSLGGLYVFVNAPPVTRI